MKPRRGSPVYFPLLLSQSETQLIWGATIPLTTYHGVHHDGFVSAGKNFQKAIRFAKGIDFTYLRPNNSLKRSIRYWAFNKKEDRYQVTYPKTGYCKKVGKAGNPPNVDLMSENYGEYGLYSMTHWKQLPAGSKECCIGIGSAISQILPAIMQMYANLGQILNLLSSDFLQQLISLYLNQIFDLQAMLDMVEALECLSDLVESMGELQEMLNEASEVAQELQELMDSFINGAGLLEGIQEILGSIGNVGDALQTLGSVLDEPPEFIDISKGIVESHILAELDKLNALEELTSVLDLFNHFQKAKENVIQAALEILQDFGVGFNMEQIVSSVIGETIDKTLEFIEKRYDEADIDYLESEGWEKLRCFAIWRVVLKNREREREREGRKRERERERERERG